MTFPVIFSPPVPFYHHFVIIRSCLMSQTIFSFPHHRLIKVAEMLYLPSEEFKFTGGSIWKAFRLILRSAWFGGGIHYLWLWSYRAESSGTPCCSELYIHTWAVIYLSCSLWKDSACNTFWVSGLETPVVFRAVRITRDGLKPHPSVGSSEARR